MDESQQEAFGRAVERKNEQAEQRANVRTGGEPSGEGSPQGHSVEEVQDPLVESGRPQDVTSVRDKSSGKGKMTADKWNQ